MDQVFKAFTRAAAMMFTPRVWGLVWRPSIIAMVFWGIIGWGAVVFFWSIIIGLAQRLTSPSGGQWLMV